MTRTSRAVLLLLTALLALACPVPAGAVADAGFTLVSPPTVTGIPRWGKTLTVSAGSWTPTPTTVTYQWLRDGQAIGGANGPRHTLVLADYGRRLSVKVAVQSDGVTKTSAYSERTRTIDHRVPVSRRFSYRIATRGDIVTSTRVFADLAAETFARPQGWRSAGIELTRVASGGDLLLVLASADAMTTFGSACSRTWSCRVGRYVVINQSRWLHASPAWNEAGLSLRAYRDLVVNHETGHWLGHGHRGCPGAGQPAPVMMQQSIGRDGCLFNPFPLPGERWTSR